MRVSSTASAKRPGSSRKARRQHVDHRRREHQRHRQQHDLAREQQREDAVGEKSRARGAALLADAGIGRHEGGVEGAFGEDRAEMIGQAQRHEKGVGHRPGAQHRRQDDVADEAGDAREQRKAADGENAFNHRGMPCCTAKCCRIGLKAYATIADSQMAELP